MLLLLLGILADNMTAAYAAAETLPKETLPGDSSDLSRVNLALPLHTSVSLLPPISDAPSELEVLQLRLARNALVPAATGKASRGNRSFAADNRSAAASADETAEFVGTLRKLSATTDPYATKDLREFVVAYPSSQWSPALKLELARRCFKQGYFQEGVGYWHELWRELKDNRDSGSVEIAAEALSQLLDAHMGLGKVAELQALIGEQEGRPGNPVIEAKLGRAKQALWLLKHKGAQNVMCGPLALYSIFDYRQQPFVPIRLNNVTDDYIATGISLVQVAEYAAQYGLNLVAARRTKPGAVIPTPAVVHWTVGHYSAITERQDAAYLFCDKGLAFTGWVPAEAVDRLASGYFLIPAETVGDGWQVVSKQEASRVFGRDGLHGQAPTDESTGRDDEKEGGDDDPCKGMPHYTFHPQVASLRVEDTPLGYTPPVGPAVNFTVSYNDLDASNPAGTRNHSNVGQIWSMDWVAFLDHVPGALANGMRLKVHLIGGGTESVAYSSTSGQFGPADQTFSKVTRSGTATYVRTLPDGSKEVYDAPDNPTAPTRVFMTQRIDPAGNALTFTYDSNLRLVAVTDAIGQVTTLGYGVAEDIWKVTQITDPFGRVARLSYNGPNLASVTDVIGLTSTFQYDGNGFMTNMTTPYGTTSFKLESGGLQSYNRAITATDPLGNREKVQFIEPIDVPQAVTPVPSVINVRGVAVPFSADTSRQNFRNSFYWSKKAMAEAPDDYASAKNFRWFTDANYVITPVLEATKLALEERVWYNYPGQAAGYYPYYAGRGAAPEKRLRMLSDGTPQLFQTYRNALGYITNYIDPLGRSTIYVYASNLVDLIEVRQLNGTSSDLLARLVYNSQHRPIRITDAAGQTTTNTYNARGQLLSTSNPLGQARTLAYDYNGYLVAIDGPLPGTNDTTRLTYDPVGRLRTVSDVDGYTLTYAYDNLDRLTRITYPDGTYEGYTYDRLDRAVMRDRMERETRHSHNPLRQLVQTVDPLGRTNRFDYCDCGALIALTDAMGRITRWHYDVQGRLSAKEYVDGSRISYAYERTSSRLKSVTDEKGQIKLYDYYLDNNRRQVSYPNAIVPTPTVTFTYETNYNQIRTMQDGIGLTTYQYHPAGALGGLQVASVDGPWNNDTITYVYDPLGRVINRAINGVAQTMAYDQAGRTTNIVNVLGSFRYAYDGATRRLLDTFYPNGQTTHYDYFDDSNDHRLQRITHRKPDTSLLSSFTYAYTPHGTITNWFQELGAYTEARAAAYDAADQLTSVAATTSAGTTNTTYTYDKAGNRLVEQVASSRREFSYNALNEIIASKDSTTNETAYEWDAEQRLTAIDARSTRTEFAYDGLGRRCRIVEKQNGVLQDEQRILWCDLSICEQRNNANETMLRFLGAGEQQGALALYYSRDHLGSIRELTDDSCNLRARYSYQNFGVSTRLVGDLEAARRFTGHVHHSSGLAMAPYRLYDPSTARWLNRDPLGEQAGVNLYAYVFNSPMNHVDPLGLDCMSDLLDELKDDVANQNEDYEFDKKKDNYGKGWKCNKYVYDKLKKQGIETRPRGRQWPLTAGEWGNPRTRIPNCRPLGPTETPRPGDVVGNRLPPVPGEYSGHVGIVTSSGFTSAHGYKPVDEEPLSHMYPGSNSDYLGDPVFWRCSCPASH